MTEFKRSIVNIAEICSQKKISDIIVSPGSRSAPLTLAFLRHPKLKCRTIVDERSAAFIALGLAQQTQKPVGLVCTSGTAGLNYGPAVAEAYYQKIPLLIFTADRPPEWIDQNDGQTIDQREMYGKRCRGYFELPVDDTHPDAKWYCERITSEAINKSLWPTPGPVQVNVPLREPLYPKSDFKYQSDAKIISHLPAQNVLLKNTWNEIASVWAESNKILIVAGMHSPNSGLIESLSTIQKIDKVTFLCDVTSNLQQAEMVCYYDSFLGTENEEMLKELAPDLLITFGGPVVSKSLKLFLRKFKPRMHWQLQTHGDCIDTFQSLRQVIQTSAAYFFQNLLAVLEFKAAAVRNSNENYSSSWLNMQSKAEQRLQEFFETAPHCELKAMHSVLKNIPPEGNLQLGNSSIVRLASFVGLTQTSSIRVNSNRGTSGIDGTLSTAVGAALATPKLTTLILGDLAFFYDRNGLWNDYLPPNLRVIIFNNYGGGIFRILDGSSDLPELEQHFEVEHNLSAKNTAEDHGLNYFFCDSTKSLEETLPEFFSATDKPAILEVHFDKHTNAEMFFKFKSSMKELK